MTENRIDWHSAFYGAVGLEFLDNDSDLQYESEHQLNHNPIRIDLLVIKKNKEVELANELGARFLGHNIMEYKSEKDELSIDTIFKANAYAALYKAYGAEKDIIKADDITVTLARRGYPRDAFKALVGYGYEIDNFSQGLYMITGKYIFPTQIAVLQEMNKELHFWLTNLHKGIAADRMKEAILRVHELRGKAGIMYGVAYIEALVEANMKAIKELSKEEGFDMGKVMEEILHDRLEQKKNEGRISMLAELVSDGVLTIADAAKKVGLTEIAFRKIAMM